MTQVKVDATYQSNYNGWDVVVDGKDADEDGNSKLVSDLVDYTSDFCDDDGVFEYYFENHVNKCNAIIEKHYPNATINIDEDDTST